MKKKQNLNKSITQLLEALDQNEENHKTNDDIIKENSKNTQNQISEKIQNHKLKIDEISSSDSDINDLLKLFKNSSKSSSSDSISDDEYSNEEEQEKEKNESQNNFNTETNKDDNDTKSIDESIYDDQHEESMEKWTPSLEYETLYKIYAYFDKMVPFTSIICTVHQCYGNIKEAVRRIAAGQVSDDISQIVNKPSDNDKDREVAYYC